MSFYDLALVVIQYHFWGFPGGSDGKESALKAGDPASTPGLGRFHGEGNGHPLQYSCLENSMDRGAWRATVHGVTKKTLLSITKTYILCMYVYIHSKMYIVRCYGKT